MTGRPRRVGVLTAAGIVDSLGLACGWTVVNLLAVDRDGLSGVATLNAAMLLGTALASPTARWLTRRLHGRHVLELTGLAELILRAATFALLYWDAPLAAVVAVVIASNIAGWTGYAAMRAEIATEDASASAMTRYVTATIGVEAVGATVAALLPISTAGQIAPHVLAGVVVAYAGSLVPTLVVARTARVGRVVEESTSEERSSRTRLLVAGGLLSVLCSGPTLLFVGLSVRLHGQHAVVGAAIAFAVGSLLAPGAIRMAERSGLPGAVTWPLWGAGMVIGWAAAPWSSAGLWLAQVLSGVCLVGFQGVMDAALAGAAGEHRSTAALAHSSAVRALGGAVAVRALPAVAGAAALTGYAASVGVLCLLAAAAARVALNSRAGLLAPAPRS